MHSQHRTLPRTVSCWPHPWHCSIFFIILRAFTDTRHHWFPVLLKVGVEELNIAERHSRQFQFHPMPPCPLKPSAIHLIGDHPSQASVTCDSSVGVLSLIVSPTSSLPAFLPLLCITPSSYAFHPFSHLSSLQSSFTSLLCSRGRPYASYPERLSKCFHRQRTCFLDFSDIGNSYSISSLSLC